MESINHPDHLSGSAMVIHVLLLALYFRLLHSHPLRRLVDCFAVVYRSKRLRLHSMNT